MFRLVVNMRNIAIPVVFILFLTQISCRNTKGEKIVLDWLGKKITVIDSLPLYSSKEELFITGDFITNQEKIIVYINGTCFTCLEDLVYCKKIVKDMSDADVKFLFYIHASDFDIVRLYLKRWKFSYPVILDKKNIFFTTNKVSDNKLLQAMILDKYNRVKFIGNPVGNKEIQSYYYQYFKIE